MSKKLLLLCLKLIITSTQIKKLETEIFLRYWETTGLDLDIQNLFILFKTPSSPFQHNFDYNTATESYILLLSSPSTKK